MALVTSGARPVVTDAASSLVAIHCGDAASVKMEVKPKVEIQEHMIRLNSQYPDRV